MNTATNVAHQVTQKGLELFGLGFFLGVLVTIVAFVILLVAMGLKPHSRESKG